MTDPFASYESRVRSAQAAYEGALAAYRHSPNSETARIAGQALAARDYRLDQLWASLTFEERAEIEARPMRQLTSA